MAKTAMIRARMEPALKAEAERVLATIGLSPTEAIGLFYRRVVLRRGLPFALRIPNAKTRAAVKDARARKKLHSHASAAAVVRAARA